MNLKHVCKSLNKLADDTEDGIILSGGIYVRIREILDAQDEKIVDIQTVLGKCIYKLEEFTDM